MMENSNLLDSSRQSERSHGDSSMMSNQIMDFNDFDKPVASDKKKEKVKNRLSMSPGGGKGKQDAGSDFGMSDRYNQLNNSDCLSGQEDQNQILFVVNLEPVSSQAKSTKKYQSAIGISTN